MAKNLFSKFGLFFMGAVQIHSLYLLNCSESTNTHYVHIREKSFFSKFSKFSEL
ncbi:hypothetical protein T4D_7312 [Trichinella pseudospiralis]|uniref:Uncharacterized protein n=1 Tax=Trichinella pseudospiralis TaxID=6337 RepID=A0A0V1F0E6_TRIPS|nr:hypothetical protein T4D_7090 [Trichinella pseudospiralis]KRY80108.1 hypothetical protein T4D_7312 [Trichinella pseudospiralis]